MHPHSTRAAAWSAAVFGSRRWLLYPPGLLNADAINASMPAIEFFQKALPAIMHELGAELYEFEQQEGEVVFVPEGWAHATLNLEPCVGASRQLSSYRHDDPQDIQDILRADESLFSLPILSNA